VRRKELRVRERNRKEREREEDVEKGIREREGNSEENQQRIT
jgi:hypothetical protein